MNAKDLARELVNVPWAALQTATSSLRFSQIEN